MEKTKSISIVNAFPAGFFLVAGLLIFAPLLKNQMITGPLVNFLLFSSAVLLGRGVALSFCVFPSVISLASGLLPLVLAPVVPFIVLSNMILVLSFDFLRKKNLYLAVILSALLKFLFLSSTSSLVLAMFNKSAASQVALMMGYPQLLTALAGGFLAIVFLKIINEKKKHDF
ncbi:MAG: iron hydrogenase [Candidatus Pacebacteria bacterium]|nr:iron hydrogenase [Candidatus Paceibacterota bacterium]